MRTFTIGEVLNRLKDEFDDITISKIRFLESEGLINPERTDSGYRKFAEDDVERLRYVLRAQRDRYLPLKVIKDELARLDSGPGDAADGATAIDAAVEPEPASSNGPVLAASAVYDEPAVVLDGGLTDVQLSALELCDATGLEEADVSELAELGLLSSDGVFDGDDLQIARAAAELLALGLDPRHLRMFRQFADRESALYQQLVTPLLKQRNPDSRRGAATQLGDLVRHGGRLHRILLGRELRELLRS